MQLRICQKYNRAVHSYLAHLSLTSDTINPAVFVVKDSPINPLPAGSSSLSADTSSVPDDPEENGGSSSSGSSEEVEPQMSSGEPEPIEACTPIAIRVLVSIASLTDMDVIPEYSIGYNQLYRSSSVSIMSRSKSHMDTILDEVLADLQTNARIQGLVNTPFEVFTAEDVVTDSDQDQLYSFR